MISIPSLKRPKRAFPRLFRKISSPVSRSDEIPIGQFVYLRIP